MLTLLKDQKSFTWHNSVEFFHRLCFVNSHKQLELRIALMGILIVVDLLFGSIVWYFNSKPYVSRFETHWNMLALIFSFRNIIHLLYNWKLHFAKVDLKITWSWTWSKLSCDQQSKNGYLRLEKLLEWQYVYQSTFPN